MYYMPYDNDLDEYRTTIIGRITAGITGDTTVASVLADAAGPGGMRRYDIRHGRVEETTLAAEDSADTQTLLDFVRWFAGEYPADKYCLILLDHGGDVDQLCRDDYPGSPGRKYMSGAELGRGLRALPGDIRDRIELLFLQQCRRGTLENLYSFRGAARYLLVSPVGVGAPNSYYTAFHRWLEEHPEADGATLARTIAENDDDYLCYTCIAGEKLTELPRRLDTVLGYVPHPSRSVPLLPLCDDEMTVADAVVLLTGSAADSDGIAAASFFTQWLNRELIVKKWTRYYDRESYPADGCGLGMNIPSGPDALELRGNLELYSDSVCQLGAWWRR